MRVFANVGAAKAVSWCVNVRHYHGGSHRNSPGPHAWVPLAIGSGALVCIDDAAVNGLVLAALLIALGLTEV